MNEFAQTLVIIRDFTLIIVSVIILIMGVIIFRRVLKLLESFDNISEQVDGITTKFSQKFINPESVDNVNQVIQADLGCALLRVCGPARAL